MKDFLELAYTYRVVATVIGTLADARTCFPNIILLHLVLEFIFIRADTENVGDYDHVIFKLISVTDYF